MTDDTRAEQAFRDAFAREADHLDGPEHVVRRPRRWPVLAAAAAVIAVVGAGLVLTPDDPPPASDAPSATPTPDAPDATESPVAADAPLPDPEPGWRWVSWRGVAVQAPVAWGYDLTPLEAWCTLDRENTPREPYVAQDPNGVGIGGVGCVDGGPAAPAGFGPGPERLWVPHLSFVDRGAPDLGEGPVPDGVSSYDGWTLTTRTVGDVQVQVLSDAATEDVAAPALASLREVEVDQDGCATRSEITAEQFVRPPIPVDLSTIDDVRSVAVCKYARDTGWLRPGLIGSRTIHGDAAADLVAAITSSPVGGGPDRPQNCVDDMYGDTAIVLRVTDGAGEVHDAFVYYDWCFGNGIDDGTRRYALTAASCRPLFAEPPVEMYSGSTHVYRVCAS